MPVKGVSKSGPVHTTPDTTPRKSLTIRSGNMQNPTGLASASSRRQTTTTTGGEATGEPISPRQMRQFKREGVKALQQMEAPAAKRQKLDKGKGKAIEAPKVLTSTEKLAALKDPESGLRIVFFGGGPRTTTQVSAEIDFLHKHAADFKRVQAAGGKYNIQSVVVERRSEEDLGRGNAWGAKQGFGTVNTGAESLGIDYYDRMEAWIVRNRAQLEAAYGSNPIPLKTLVSAFEGNDAPGDGRPQLGRGVLTRADQGREENEHFLRQAERVANAFPFYHLSVLTGTAAVPDFTENPIAPDVKLYSVDPTNELAVENQIGTIKADAVRLNTGTTVAEPALQPGVREHAFIEPMDPAALRQFFADKDMLGEDGMLKPDARVVIGGFGLSMIDQAIALHEVMGLFQEVDGPHGKDWQINPEAVQKYQGTVTIVSNTGTPIPPRLTGKSPAWTQRDEPMGTPRQLHAAFLHKQGEKVFTDWEDIIKGSVARTLDKTPDQLMYPGMDVEQKLAGMFENTLLYEAALDRASQLPAGAARDAAYKEAARLEEGALRQAYFGSNIGVGMARDLGQTIEQLSADAPFTAKGRVGTYLPLNAQPAGLTQVNEDGTLPENRQLVGMFDKRMSYLTSSPSKVWPLVARLFGYDNHGTPDNPDVRKGPAIFQAMLGSYGNLLPNEQGDDKPLQFTAKNGSRLTFDAFIVSPTFNPGAEPAVAALAGNIEPVHPQLPTIGKVTQNGQLLAPGGQVATHVENYGLTGKGAFVPGTNSKLGETRYDINNKESATAVAPGLAERRFAAEHLKAVGIQDAYERVEAIYAEFMPTEAQYRAEVEPFADDFRSMQETAVRIRTANSVAQRNGAGFRAVTDALPTMSTFEAKAALLEPQVVPMVRAKQQGVDPTDAERARAAAHNRAGALFHDGLNEMEPFQPAPRERFFERFANFPAHIHEAVYQRALQMALHHRAGGATQPEESRTGG